MNNATTSNSTPASEVTRRHVPRGGWATTPPNNGKSNRAKKRTRPVGLSHASAVTTESIRLQSMEYSTDQVEKKARQNAARLKPWMISMISVYAALKVFCIKLITIDSAISCSASIGLTIWIYKAIQQRQNNDPYYGSSTWSGRMDWVLLGFAVITPISVAINIAFSRRERALIELANFRSFSFQLYMIHTMWDWVPNGREEAASSGMINWLQHSDQVLTNLVGIADELYRFLTLPTCSRSRHRVTRVGRQEASMTVEAAYRLLDSCVTRRFIYLSKLGEKLKQVGFPSGEASRLKQYERFMNGSIEQLRMIKMYRSPQALRAFARLFSILIPPLYSPYYADLSLRVQSLALGIIFAILTSIALTALTETVENLEDPFVGYLTLDGINVREELSVLHWHQLVNARKMIFPSAPFFPKEQAPEIPYPSAVASMNNFDPASTSFALYNANNKKSYSSASPHESRSVTTSYSVATMAPPPPPSTRSIGFEDEKEKSQRKDEEEGRAEVITSSLSYASTASSPILKSKGQEGQSLMLDAENRLAQAEANDAVESHVEAKEKDEAPISTSRSSSNSTMTERTRPAGPGRIASPSSTADAASSIHYLGGNESRAHHCKNSNNTNNTKKIFRDGNNSNLEHHHERTDTRDSDFTLFLDDIIVDDHYGNDRGLSVDEESGLTVDRGLSTHTNTSLSSSSGNKTTPSPSRQNLITNLSQLKLFKQRQS